MSKIGQINIEIEEQMADDGVIEIENNIAEKEKRLAQMTGGSNDN